MNEEILRDFPSMFKACVYVKRVHEEIQKKFIQKPDKFFNKYFMMIFKEFLQRTKRILAFVNYAEKKQFSL